MPTISHRTFSHKVNQIIFAFPIRITEKRVFVNVRIGDTIEMFLIKGTCVVLIRV